VNSGAKGLTLELEHLFLEGDAAWGSEAAHFAVIADYTVTGDN